MNNFTQRTLSSIVYVAVVVSSILVHPMYFGAVFLIISMLATREFMMLMGVGKIQRIGTAILSGLQFATVFALLTTTWQEIILASMCYAYPLLLIGMLIAELFLKAENPIHNWGLILQSQLMVALPFSLMNVLLSADKHLLLALFIAIWINDSGAYIVGSLMGKRKSGNHKMFPRVSPGKSWEGLIGGILFTMLAGYIFYRVGWFSAIPNALIFTLIVSVFGTLGDLMESLMKRTIGVKDSGKFMPGHGGVLDRFDSCLLATPIITLLVMLFV